MATCIKCGRKLTTDKPYYSPELRGYLGPHCARLMYAPSVKEINRKAQKYESLVNEIWGKESHRPAGYVQKYPFGEGRSLYDVRGIGQVLHPDLFEETDVHSIPAIDPFNTFSGVKFDYDARKYYLKEVDEPQRVLNLNSFLNLFKDPLLGSSLDVFNKLGIRLAYHTPVLIDKRERVDTSKGIVEKNPNMKFITRYGGQCEASFIISADNSPYPERMLWFRTNLDAQNIPSHMYSVNVLHLKPNGEIHCSQSFRIPPIQDLWGVDLKLKNLRSFTRLVDTFFQEKNPYDVWEFYRYTRSWCSVSEKAWKDYPIKGPRGSLHGGNTWDTSSAMLFDALNHFGEDLREREPDEVARRRVRKRYRD